LSGGQRARVALARTLYSRTRILLLDDPLSALDHQTAESIVYKCFSGELVRDRTVVFVTHRTSLVHQLANQYVEVSNGKIMATSEDPFLRISKEDQQDENSKDRPDESNTQAQKSMGNEVGQEFIEEERREHGAIKGKVWLAFIRAGKFWWLLLLTMMSLTRVANVVQTWFFKIWGEMYGESRVASTMVTRYPDIGFHLEPSSPLIIGAVEPLISLDPIDYLPNPNDNLNPWLVVLLVVSLAQASCLTLYACSQLTAVWATSKVMFEQAMVKVTTATFRFYDTTPVGRIMNRLTSDIQTLDSALNYFGHTIFFFSLFVSSIIVIASVSPIFLLFSGALMGVFVFIFRQFLPASQSLKRLESVSLSPIYSIFDELLQNQGLTTVRAFHAQNSFHDRTVTTIDNYQGFGHFYSSVQNWLMFRYENISAFSMFTLTLIALITDLSAGLTAFMLFYADNFILATHTLCIRLADLQTEFISVERLVELIDTEQEPKGTLSPPASWPQFGSDIVFDHVTVRYAPHLDPSLKDVSFRIPGGSTTAIIGRTGSGKSTLASAILNIVRADTGNITIDNVSLTNIDVHALRRRITYVAQDPVLFLGTIRQNLDPIDEFTDDECEAVLARVCMGISGQEWTLETHVEAGGRNLSQGQRQLIGIARAVLRRSPIVILDEATASIDIATSVELQNIIREELKEVTIIMIAHRVEAVQGADYCVVLQNGCVLRQGEVSGEISAINSEISAIESEL
jgi:ABC-type multidrug transport system fused ATPase/permease subunit